MASPFRLTMSSTDPDAAHEWLGEYYMPQSARLSGDPRHFRARHLNADFDGFSANIFEDSMATQLDAGPTSDVVLVLQTLSGVYTATHDRTTVVANPGECLVINPDALHDINWEDNLRLCVLRFDRARLERIAAELTGHDEGEPLRFPLAKPLSARKADAWRSFMRYLTRDFVNNDAARGSELICGQALRMAVATLLETFPNTALTRDTAECGEADPDPVRRAVAFIEESAAADIDLTQIATVARVSPRALQQAFRRHRDTTPLGHLRKVRLEHAHQELRTADPDTTVTEIATRWGFANLGRFAAEYRQRYGCLPSRTLRR